MRTLRDNFYVVYRYCFWIDSHKKVIVACSVNGRAQELREFGATTDEIKSLANWLTESGCEMIAMESAGVFWKSQYNPLVLMDLYSMIVNAAHMEALSEHKMDVKEAEWIAYLLRRSLLKLAIFQAGNSVSYEKLPGNAVVKSTAFRRFRRESILNRVPRSKTSTKKARASYWKESSLMISRIVGMYLDLFMVECSQSWVGLSLRLKKLPCRYKVDCWRKS